MTQLEPDTDLLLDRVARDDALARDQLLGRHRTRLRQMVALRLHPRLAARIDPSDVAQETLAEAAQKLQRYVRERPLPFYPWLRQIAWDRLLHLHRSHLRAAKRTVSREDPFCLALPDESASALAGRLVDRGSSPSSRLQRHELRSRVQAFWAQLDPREREILVLRYLEHLSTREIAAILGLTTAGVKTRQLRALQHLRNLLGNDFEE